MRLEYQRCPKIEFLKQSKAKSRMCISCMAELNIVNLTMQRRVNISRFLSRYADNFLADKIINF